MGLQHHHRRGIKSAATLLVCRPTPTGSSLPLRLMSGSEQKTGCGPWPRASVPVVRGCGSLAPPDQTAQIPPKPAVCSTSVRTFSLMGSGVCSLCGERQAPVSGSRLRHGGSSRPGARSRSWCRCSAGRDIASCGNGFSHHLLLARLSDCCLLATPALPRHQLPPIAARGGSGGACAWRACPAGPTKP